jgi:hypothetical protein
MYWYNNKNLSDNDIELLARTETVERMMRNRVTVDFGDRKIPSFDDIGLDSTHDLYYIKILGQHVLQFWFCDTRDLIEFEQTLHEYKIKAPVNEDK